MLNKILFFFYCFLPLLENHNYGGNSCHKLKALIKKNLIVLKRNKGGTACEIFFPIFIMLLLSILRNAFAITSYDYDEVEGNTENFIKRRSLANVDITHPDINITNTTVTWNRLNFLPHYTICSANNRLKVERPIIATIGVPNELKERMIYDSILIEQNTSNFTLSKENFMDFDSVKQMEKYIKNKNYGTKERPLICFGMSFEEKGESSYRYSLHYFDSIFNEGIKDINDMINGPFDIFQTGPEMYALYRYSVSGYPYIMKIIHEYILKKETNNQNASINFGIMAMKYVNYKYDSFINYVGLIVPFFIVVGYMCPLCLYIYRMVSEKESGAKEGMKIMGLTDGIYFTSYFLQYLLISIFVSIVNTIIFRWVYRKIPFYFIFLIFFLWAMNIFSLAFFFQSFIDSTRYALILSLLIYFVMYFISMACLRVTDSKSIKVCLSFFPPVTLVVGIVLISEFECHFKKFHPRFFTEVYTNYSLSYMYLQFVIDFFIFLILGYYLQNVVPRKYGIRKPFYFIFSSEFWCGKKHRKKTKNKSKKQNSELNTTVNKLNEDEHKRSESDSSDLEELYPNNPNFENEKIYKNKAKKNETLCIRNIRKTFEDGKTAVDHINLNFYKDEIFALLGHNGAGKTTLISMLTGLYEATEGNAYYEGEDILIGENMDKFRLKLGICPQHDILFEDLTIKEHLDMFSIFKGVPSELIENEINKTLNDFQLSEIQDLTVDALSAGKKRQLSIALALIGGSKVIFLDEPSSGMDITARRNLWEILKRQLEQKIIILTTHYMEEASVLGNRIGIISDGKMKCIGTPLFLIEKFGKYMTITMSKDENAVNEDIMNYMNSKTKDIQYEVLSEEIIVRIPKSNYSDGNNIDLGQFFNDFDNNLERLKIKSYSVSMPTLEDVFLNVAAKYDAQTEEERLIQMEKEMNNDKILFETIFNEDYSKKSKFCNDSFASFKRRIFLILRDLKSSLMELLCPILLVLIGLLVSKVKFKWSSDPWIINISQIGKQNVVYSSIDGINNIEDYYFSENYPNVTCQTLDIGNFTQDQKYESIVAFVDEMFEISKHTEDSKLKEVDMFSDNYVGYFGALLMLHEENNNYEFLELLNQRITHALPIYSFYFMKQIIENAAGHKVYIEFEHHPMPLTNDVKSKSDQIINSIVVLFISTAFSLIPSSFITMLVKERRNNSKHLMRVSGINILSYWMVNYAFELFKYYFACGVCIFFIWVFDHYRRYLTLLYLLYGPAMVSSTYVLSFLFYKESFAQNGAILLNVLVGALGGITVLILRGMDYSYKTGKALEYILSILPSFCFDFGYDLLLNKMVVFLVDYPNDWMSLTDKDLIKKFNLLLLVVVYLIIEILVYTFLLFIAEKCTYVYKKPPDYYIEPNVNDSLVLKEIEKANLEQVGVTNEKGISNKTEYSLRLKNIQKIYTKGYFCWKKEIVGIKYLNFCVEPNECFGLLGLNGAGKTTAFKCITQKLSPTNGTVYINGKDTSNKFKEFKSLIGYCPQYDAIFKYMTVYENLEFYARIKGVKIDLIDQLVSAIIEEMSLKEYTNKVAGKLSGGNKRKLSVAISLLCTPKIILLDEPSTGMDPEARRFMWSIIHKISLKGKNSSIVMSTHSMDEAETLCRRMGIMVNGEFVCFGKASQIKDKYGYGYEINLRVKPLNLKQQNEIISKLNEKNLRTLSNNAVNIDTSNIYINNYENINIIYAQNTKLNKENIFNILSQLNINNYCSELKADRLGKRIVRDIEINGNISLSTLLNWVFFVRNAFKFIKNIKRYFEEIILSEFIENNFLFKLKKGPNSKSIGFFFGLFEKYKDECFISEYSIQPTSLEQIFNKFAQEQISVQSKKIKNQNLNSKRKYIIVDDELFQQLLY